jgi:hypothetical protein
MAFLWLKLIDCADLAPRTSKVGALDTEQIRYQLVELPNAERCPIALDGVERFARAVDVKLAAVQSLPVSMWGIISVDS